MALRFLPRFNMRMVLLAFTAATIWMGLTARIVRNRKAILANASFVIRDETPGKLSWMRCIMGDESVKELWIAQYASDEELARAKREFPEAVVSRGVTVERIPNLGADARIKVQAGV